MAEEGSFGVFVVNRIQKEYPNVFSQKGYLAPLTSAASMRLASLLVWGCYTPFLKNLVGKCLFFARQICRHDVMQRS